LAEPGFSAAGHDEDLVAAQAKKLKSSLPWLGRGPIEEAARAYAQSPVSDIADWVHSVRLTSARAAVVIADDLPSSVALVRKLEGDHPGTPGAAIADDMIRFWISEAAFVLRRRLGLA
jgi:hypothetical protein